MATRATILGVDTAAGAYLARLLNARGYRLSGTGGPALLAALGVADAVIDAESPAAAIAAVGADEVYDLREDAGPIVDLVASGGSARMFVAVTPGDDRVRAAVAAARGQGAWLNAGTVWPHESRLGPGKTPIARIVAAAAAGRDPSAADLATNTDCGWTAEYVDAMWRTLQRPAPVDVTIATGRLLTGSDAALAAATWFKRAVPVPVTASAGTPGDPAVAHALGWRATTWGDDLVAVLCEGAAAA